MGIYDIAGNVREWTLEHATSDPGYPCAIRGGCYLGTDSYPDVNASYRIDCHASYASYTIGFRAALY